MYWSKGMDNLGSKQICLVCRRLLGKKNKNVETACRHIFHITCLVRDAKVALIAKIYLKFLVRV